MSRGELLLPSSGLLTRLSTGVTNFSSSVNFIGPVAGPLVGSGLISKYNWRSIEWFVFAYAASLTVINAMILPETYAAVILRDRAVKLRQETGNQKLIAELEEKELTFGYVFHTYFLRPVKMLTMDPIIQAFAFFTALTFGILYLTFVAFPVEYRQERQWSQIQSTLPNIGIIVGVLFGLVACVWWQPRYNVALRNNDGKPVPEMRLPLLVVGAAVFP